MSTFGNIGAFHNNTNDLTLLLQNKQTLNSLNNQVNLFSNNFKVVDNNTLTNINIKQNLNNIQNNLNNNLTDISLIQSSIQNIINDNSDNNNSIQDISSQLFIMQNDISINTNIIQDISLSLSSLNTTISNNTLEISNNTLIISNLLNNNGFANFNEFNNNITNLNINNNLINQNISDIYINKTQIQNLNNIVAQNGTLDISLIFDNIQNNNNDISNNINDLLQYTTDNSQNIIDINNNTTIIDSIPEKNKLFAVQRNLLSSSSAVFRISFDNLIINQIIDNNLNQLANDGSIQFLENGKYLITLQLSIEHLTGGTSGDDNFIQFYRNNNSTIVNGTKTDFNVYSDTNKVYNQIKFLLNVTSTSDIYYFLLTQSNTTRLQILSNTCRLFIEKFE